MDSYATIDIEVKDLKPKPEKPVLKPVVIEKKEEKKNFTWVAPKKHVIKDTYEKKK